MRVFAVVRGFLVELMFNRFAVEAFGRTISGLHPELCTFKPFGFGMAELQSNPSGLLWVLGKSW
jgi:hypothetical protein